ncbi:MAG: ATP-binding cassette domain-containing protein [Pseudomonadota bacterium]
MDQINTSGINGTPLLQVEHLTMRFGGLVAIDDLSFSAYKGDITALIGPNGAGKTTVFNCITGFYKPTEGRIAFAHEPEALRKIDAVTETGKRHDDEGAALYLLERMPDFEIARDAKVARTFQNIRLFGGMTVLENLMVAQHNALMVSSAYSIAGLFNFKSYREGQAYALERAQFWLDKTGLTDRADDPAADLPYGDQRRLEIALAMCTEPRLLCLDEPAAGLNAKESAELNKLLLFIGKEYGTSVLLIEHDMSVVMEISDHVVVLDYGRKIADESPESVRNDPKVIAAYLGVDEDEATGLTQDDNAQRSTDVAPAEKPATSAPRAAKVADTLSAANDVQTKAAAASTTGIAKRPKTTTKAATAKKPVAAAKPTKPKKPTAAQLRREQAEIDAKLAALPKGASAFDKANAVGKKPVGLPKPRKAGADDLKLVKGIGPVNEKKLNELGVYHFDQIAKWDRPQIAWVGTFLAFPGRIDREEWTRQAHTLANPKKAVAKPAAKKPAARKTAAKGAKK